MNKAEIINGLEDLVRSTEYSLVCLQGENSIWLDSET